MELALPVEVVVDEIAGVPKDILLGVLWKHSGMMGSKDDRS